MDRDLIMKYLSQPNNRQQIYKQYFDLQQQNEPALLEGFLTLYSKEELKDLKMSFPGTKKDVLSPGFFTDENIFTSDQNIALLKHDNYTPYFTHSHAIFELCYVLKGHCEQHISGEEFTMTEGDFLFIALGTQHAIGVFDEESIVINLLIKQSTFDTIYMNILRNKSVLSTFFVNNLYEDQRTDYILFRTYDDPEIRNMILDMYIEQFEQDIYSDNVLTCMMSILFNRLMRKYAKTAQLPAAQEEHAYESIEIINYLEDHIRTATLSDMASHLNYSPAYCSRLIKKATGSTFVELLREIRLRQAENLLVSTPISVEKLAYEVGYESSESFIRVFKKNRGVTPARYRESHC